MSFEQETIHEAGRKDFDFGDEDKLNHHRCPNKTGNEFTFPS